MAKNKINSIMNILDDAQSFINDSFNEEEQRSLISLYKKYSECENKDEYKLDLDISMRHKLLDFSGTEHTASDEKVLEIIKFITEFHTEKESIEKEIETTSKDILSKMKEYKTNQREMMEVNLKEKANEEQDENKKIEMLAISQAYTDSYTFDKLYEILNDPTFIKKLRKRIIRFNRFINDFDYIIDSSSMGKATSIRLNNVIKNFNNAKMFKMSQQELHTFFIALILSVQAYNPEIKIAQTWYAYSLMTNLIGLSAVTNMSDEFDKQKIEYLVKIMEKIDELLNIK